MLQLALNLELRSGRTSRITVAFDAIRQQRVMRDAALPKSKFRQAGWLYVTLCAELNEILVYYSINQQRMDAAMLLGHESHNRIEVIYMKTAKPTQNEWKQMLMDTDYMTIYT